MNTKQQKQNIANKTNKQANKIKKRADKQPRTIEQLSE